MSHKNQMEFFSLVIQHFPKNFQMKVLDIGSLDINGGPHKLFSSSEYIGVDVAEGPNVNYVCRGENVSFPNESFDVTMSSECFEHNPNWIATIQNMIRMTKVDGLLVFSAAGTGRKEHGTPRSDNSYSAPLLSSEEFYYRNISKKDVKLIIDKELIPRAIYFRNWLSRDLYFVGIKKPTLESLGKLTVLEKNISSYVRTQNWYFVYGFIKKPVRNLLDLVPYSVIFNLVIIKHKMQFCGLESHKNSCKVCKYV
jgi:SAM-dependent methyltransferase